MKRTTNQIQIAVQECDPTLTDEEMRLCIEAQRTIHHFEHEALIKLIELIREEKPMAFLKMNAEFAWGTVERMFDAAKKPPGEWLGPKHIPGSPEQQASLAWAKKLYEKATGETL